MSDPVEIRFTKWGGIPHWSFDMQRLGEDEYGIWLWMPVGTVMQRGNDPPISSRNPAVKVITRGQWWTAIWNGGPNATYECFVDIATPAVWDGDTVRLVDLDLDVAKRRGGGVEVQDEDEFEAHKVQYGYPAQVIDKARTEAARLAAVVERGDEPFGTVAGRWMEAAFGR